MKKKKHKEIVSLPLDASVKRRALRAWERFCLLVARIVSRADNRLNRYLERLRERLAIPVGTLVRQTEHKDAPEGPWKVASWTDIDYRLVRPDGQKFQRPNWHGLQEEIYVYDRYVHPLLDQTPDSPAPSPRPKQVSPLN